VAAPEPRPYAIAHLTHAATRPGFDVLTDRAVHVDAIDNVRFQIVCGRVASWAVTGAAELETQLSVQ
jgi:hypothetical protein